MRKIKLITLGILLGFINLMAQDPIFLQPLETNVNLNPALVGNDSVTRLNLIYRNECPNLTRNFVTGSANFYRYIPKLKAYAGITYLNDNQNRGLLISNNVSIFYSQNIKINQVLIRPSFEFAFGQRVLDRSKILFGATTVYRYGFVWNSQEYIPTPNKSNIDFNFGTIVYYKKLFVGFSIHHITEPDIGLQGVKKLPTRYGLQFGYEFTVKKVVLSPYAVYFRQEKYLSILIGTNALLFNHLNVGLAYRNQSYVVSNVGYQNKFFKINYSFDLAKEKNFSTSAGSHELYLSFRLNRLRL